MSAINCLLPREAILAVHLSRNLEVTVAVKEDCAHNDFVRSHGCWVAVGVGSAVGAVVAVYCVACTVPKKKDYCFFPNRLVEINKFVM